MGPQPSSRTKAPTALRIRSTPWTPNSVRVASASPPTETDDWTWSLKFDSYGRGASLDDVANPSLTADGGRVEYHYPNGVTEWYVNGPLGLQQGFTFASRPSPLVEGPLEVQSGYFR